VSESVQKHKEKVRRLCGINRDARTNFLVQDFGVIATSKGWNVYIGGNGGAKPRHAELLAADVSRKKVC
jgi:NAD(P)H-nitrite reductase large subunit